LRFRIVHLMYLTALIASFLATSFAPAKTVGRIGQRRVAFVLAVRSVPFRRTLGWSAQPAAVDAHTSGLRVSLGATENWLVRSNDQLRCRRGQTDCLAGSARADVGRTQRRRWGIEHGHGDRSNRIADPLDQLDGHANRLRSLVGGFLLPPLARPQCGDGRRPDRVPVAATIARLVIRPVDDRRRQPLGP
jgi:hypothetical protein